MNSSDKNVWYHFCTRLDVPITEHKNSFYSPGHNYPLKNRDFACLESQTQIAVRDYAIPETHNLASERLLPAGSVGIHKLWFTILLFKLKRISFHCFSADALIIITGSTIILGRTSSGRMSGRWPVYVDLCCPNLVLLLPELLEQSDSIDYCSWITENRTISTEVQGRCWEYSWNALSHEIMRPTMLLLGSLPDFKHFSTVL